MISTYFNGLVSILRIQQWFKSYTDITVLAQGK